MQEESLCPNRGDPRPVMSPPPEGAVSGTKPDTQHNSGCDSHLPGEDEQAVTEAVRRC